MFKTIGDFVALLRQTSNKHAPGWIKTVFDLPTPADQAKSAKIQAWPFDQNQVVELAITFRVVMIADLTKVDGDWNCQMKVIDGHFFLIEIWEEARRHGFPDLRQMQINGPLTPSEEEDPFFADSDDLANPTAA